MGPRTKAAVAGLLLMAACAAVVGIIAGLIHLTTLINWPDWTGVAVCFLFVWWLASGILYQDHFKEE